MMAKAGVDDRSAVSLHAPLPNPQPLTIHSLPNDAPYSVRSMCVNNAEVSQPEPVEVFVMHFPSYKMQQLRPPILRIFLRVCCRFEYLIHSIYNIRGVLYACHCTQQWNSVNWYTLYNTCKLYLNISVFYSCVKKNISNLMNHCY